LRAARTNEFSDGGGNIFPLPIRKYPKFYTILLKLKIISNKTLALNSTSHLAYAYFHLANVITM
jgi:hypothetical protein